MNEFNRALVASKAPLLSFTAITAANDAGVSLMKKVTFLSKKLAFKEQVVCSCPGPANKLLRAIMFAMIGLILIPKMESAEAASWVLDQFESSIHVVQPNSKDCGKYLWNLYGCAGTTTLDSMQKVDGTQSLHNQMTGNAGDNWQFHFYPYTENLSGWSNGWQYLRKFVNNPSMNPNGGTPAWQTGHINRMRFWLKVPPGLTESTTGGGNFEFGTYIRCSACDTMNAESDNKHYYHYYDFSSTPNGEWWQVIVDTHPDHQRGANGNTEQPDHLYPYSDGLTYFDLMTRFYLHFPYEDFSLPADFYMDGFELYEETNPENVAQVRALQTVYIPSSNTVKIGWRRPKNEDSINHEVRYAFSDIFSLGWANATPAPNGTVTPKGSGGYNGMKWSSSSLNLAGHSVLYVAIKPQNSSLFRQVSIPLGAGSQNTLGAGSQNTLSAPSGLSIIQ